MSIADIFRELEDTGWKEKKDDYKLKDGEYYGVIEKLEFRKNEKGTQWFSFTVNLIEENKKYFANLFLTDKTIRFNLQKFKTLVETLTNETLTADDFINEIELANKLSEKIAGTEVTLILQTNKNGFQNFLMEKSEMPF